MHKFADLVACHYTGGSSTESNIDAAGRFSYGPELQAIQNMYGYEMYGGPTTRGAAPFYAAGARRPAYGGPVGLTPPPENGGPPSPRPIVNPDGTTTTTNPDGTLSATGEDAYYDTPPPAAARGPAQYDTSGSDHQLQDQGGSARNRLMQDYGSYKLGTSQPLAYGANGQQYNQFETTGQNSAANGGGLTYASHSPIGGGGPGSFSENPGAFNNAQGYNYGTPDKQAMDDYAASQGNKYKTNDADTMRDLAGKYGTGNRTLWSPEDQATGDRLSGISSGPNNGKITGYGPPPGGPPPPGGGPGDPYGIPPPQIDPQTPPYQQTDPTGAPIPQDAWGTGGASGNRNLAGSAAFASAMDTFNNPNIRSDVQNAISQQGMNATRAQFAGQAGQMARHQAVTGNSAGYGAATAQMGRDEAGAYGMQARQNSIDFEKEAQRRKESAQGQMQNLYQGESQYQLGLLGGEAGVSSKLYGSESSTRARQAASPMVSI